MRLKGNKVVKGEDRLGEGELSLNIVGGPNSAGIRETWESKTNGADG
ncbi:hypothetical protein [Staphylococcus haemolyticus]|nr:hypothetical protein [Staphylococcus haemolyticus]